MTGVRECIKQILRLQLSISWCAAVFFRFVLIESLAQIEVL